MNSPLLNSTAQILPKPFTPPIQRVTQTSLTSSINGFLSAHDEFVWCPVKGCGFVFENSGPGEIDTVNFDEGVSEGAKKHYNSFRFRCRKCSENFCSQCKTVPYHCGLTCEELKAKKESLSCRFCEEPLPDLKLETHLKAIEEKRPRMDHCTACQSYADRCVKSGFTDCKHPNNYSINYYSAEYCHCLHPDCVSDASGPTSEDFCGICGIEPLKRYPVVRLTCSHIFHSHCVEGRLANRWTTNNISLSYSRCSLCNTKLQTHYGTFPGLDKANTLRRDLKIRLPPQLKSLEIEIGKKPEDEDFEDEALRKVNYYECFQCKSLYFGGLHECGEQIELPKEQLICSGCRGCKTHGSEHIVYKCRFCCALSTYFCFGHTHFCTNCHDRPWDIIDGNHYHYLKTSLPQCPGPDKCPLGIAHPPNGEEHVLGCTACSDIFEEGRQIKEPPPPPAPQLVPDLRVQQEEYQPPVGAKEEDDMARRKEEKRRNKANNQAFQFLPSKDAPAVRLNLPRVKEKNEEKVEDDEPRFPRPVVRGNKIIQLLNKFQQS